MRALSPTHHRLLWHAFNCTFIAPYQNVLLLLITLPAYIATTHAGKPLNGLDYCAVALFLAALALEATADEQQWAFQQSKHGKAPRLAKHAADYERGFLTTGLFSWSRHPNFVGEQTMWVAFYAFSIAAQSDQQQWLNWTVIGPALLILLFQGSTAFTEAITLRKYPAYAAYQRTVSRLLPMPPRLYAALPAIGQAAPARRRPGRPSKASGGASPSPRGRVASPKPAARRASGASRPTSPVPSGRTPRSAKKQ
jgi:steroid 5-alpha reductase family enzyme